MKRQSSFLTYFRIIVLTSGLLILLSQGRLASFHQLSLGIFLVLVALVRAASVELPQGDKVSLDAALVVATILLFDVPSVLVIAAGGIIIAEVGRDQVNGLGNVLFPVAQRSIVVAASALWLQGRYVTATAPGGSLNLLGADLILALCVCITFFIAEIAMDQISLSQRRASPFLPAFLGSLTLIGPIYFSLASIGILMSMMYSSMGLWSVFIFSLPLVVVYYSFELFLNIKNTYRHTISALTRAIQVEDYAQRSHSERVADLAIDVGRELGFHGERLEAIGYAALLHDIGKLGMDVDSFDALLDTRRIDEKVAPHAEIGAEILEQVAFLRPFADVVRKHHMPFTAGPNVDTLHPIEARIVALANYYDLLTESPLIERRLSANQAVARIKRESSQFDPRVMRALLNVLRRQEHLLVTT